MPSPLIRPATRAELDTMVEWAAAEGWNPGLADADAFHAADPNGFLLAFVDGEPAACVSVVAHDDTFGFLGFYIARPEFRGRGVGWAVWQAGMAYLGGRTVGLDGVVAQQANYAKSGFALVHRNVRYGGEPTVEAPSDPRLVAVTPALVPAILAYDRPFFACPRPRYLTPWLAAPRIALALIEDGRVTGYGVARACRAGTKIGPLFADTEAGADLLFRALAARADAGPVFLDLPEPNAGAVALATRHGLAPVFETARMYKGPAPSLPLSRTYGITSFELG